MKFNIKNDFWLVNGLSVALILVISFFPNPVLRNVLGWPFLLFVPGYALTSALFPRRSRPGMLARLTFSVGLSVALMPLIGLILNITPWGVTLYPILLALSVFSLLASGTAWFRRRSLPPDERPALSFHADVAGWAERKTADKVLAIALAVAVVGALGVTVYGVIHPRNREYFTEFYMLGVAAKAESYLRDVPLNRPANVLVGIISHEAQESSYDIAVVQNGTPVGTVGPIILQPGEKWQKLVEFTMTQLGDNQKVEMYLYLNGAAEPYLDTPLRIWVNVVQ